MRHLGQGNEVEFVLHILIVKVNNEQTHTNLVVLYRKLSTEESDFFGTSILVQAAERSSAHITR